MYKDDPLMHLLNDPTAKEISEIHQEILDNQRFIADMYFLSGNKSMSRAMMANYRRMRFGMDFSLDGRLDWPIMIPQKSLVPGMIAFRTREFQVLE